MQGISQHSRVAPPVSRFVVLSFLLHVLLVLLFGDATGVRHGTSLFGSFVANLESRASVLPVPASTSAPSPAANPSRVDRVTPMPGAQAENKTAEPQTQPAQVQNPAPTSTPEDAVAMTPTPASVMTPDAPAALPPLIAKEVITPETSFVVPAFAPIPDVGTAKKVQPPSPQPQPQPIAPIPPPVALEKLPAPKIENTFKPYIPPTVPAPAPTPPPTPTPTSAPVPVVPTPAPAPLEKISPPKIEQEIAPFLPPQVLAREAPALPAPSTFAPTPTPLPAPAPAPAPAPVMVAPVDRLEKLAAPKVEREFAPTPSAPVVATPVMATPSAPAVAPTNAAPNAGDLAKPRADANIAPAGATQKPSLAPPAVAGGGGTVAGPGAGTAAGNNPNPPGTLGPAPKLDLDGIRARAREIASEGSGQRAAFGFPPLPKEAPKKSIEKIFDKALQRPDCKDAYADMGLAAVVPLIRDTVKNEGCRW